ncbi:MAG: hypothetical protein LUD81_03575 [Clostridiales bacterium]|nr:hypothetical protein [Clostridiales bacterium]
MGFFDVLGDIGKGICDGVSRTGAEAMELEKKVMSEYSYKSDEWLMDEYEKILCGKKYGSSKVSVKLGRANAVRKILNERCYTYNNNSKLWYK